MVCDQVRIRLIGEGDQPRFILLPWVPSVYQEVELKAIGGQLLCSVKFGAA